jgi:hypothetical protein
MKRLLNDGRISEDTEELYEEDVSVASRLNVASAKREKLYQPFMPATAQTERGINPGSS